MTAAIADEDQYEILVDRGNTTDALGNRISLFEKILMPE